MNIEIAKQRLDKVITIDSINSSPEDFLATHVPFRKLILKEKGLASKEVSIDENQFYEKYFCDDAIYDQHKFIIVEGGPGTGKSHFIRWLYTKLKHSSRDAVLLIRRDDNTLKGTIRQLLELDEVKELKDRDIYKRLVKASNVISDSLLKTTILHQFLIQLESDTESSEYLNTLDKRKLDALMSNPEFRDKIMVDGGPIDRIFHKIINQDSGVSYDEALFRLQDFLIDVDFIEKIQNNADRRAREMAERLVPDENGISEKAIAVANYFNQKIDSVIQACSGIEPGDFQQIFKSIRQELKNQGKNLILLIEDITSFTGINQALLNALTTEHTGSYASEGMCRLISVVGTTTQYYESFRDNYKDRITDQITIGDSAIAENRQTLFEFFGKYLNAMSLPSESLSSWFQSGADPEQLPIAEDPEHKNWDSFTTGGLSFNLYPFTKTSILNFCDSMKDRKTPRYILSDIIRPALQDLMHSKKTYLSFAAGINVSYIDEDIENRLRTTAVNMKLSQEEADRAVRLVSFYREEHPSKGNVFGVDRQIWDEFQLGEIADRISVTSPDELEEPAPVEDVKSDKKVAVVNSPKPVKNEKYERFRTALQNWFYKDAMFVKPQEVRDALNDLVHEAFDWQGHGISRLDADELFSSSHTLFGFERQERALNKALIELKANNETLLLLSAIGRYCYLNKKNSWDYEGSENDIYWFTCWMERHSSEIIEKVVNSTDKKTPYFIQCSLMVQIYSRVFSGSDVSRPSLLTEQEIFTSNKSTSGQSGYCQDWNDLRQRFLQDDVTENYQFLYQWFNLSQGKSYSIHFVNYEEFNIALNSLERINFDLPENDTIEYYAKERKIIVSLYHELKQKASKALQSEISNLREKIKSTSSFFEDFPLEQLDVSDLRQLLNNAENMYIDAEKYGFLIQNRSEKFATLKNNVDRIYEAIKFCLKLLSETDPMKQLFELSSPNIGILADFCSSMKMLEDDYRNLSEKVRQESDDLKRKGIWKEDVDPRFEENNDLFETLAQEVNNVIR